jgi:hypothetical protein
MIALSSDYLLFELASGENVPFSADMISVELVDAKEGGFDEEFMQHAAKGVFHYFKHELGCESITVGEFAAALEKVLRGLSPKTTRALGGRSCPPVLESDLGRLAAESGAGCELFFFPLLREEMRRQLQQTPRLLRFRGLRKCVKQLTGARRWSRQCSALSDQIVAYLRECMGVEFRQDGLTVLVE